MTKLSENPNYGRPSARKLQARIETWKQQIITYAMLREIRAKIRQPSTFENTFISTLD